MEDIDKIFKDSPECEGLIKNEIVYYFPKWLTNKVKEKTFNSLLDEDKKFLFQCLLLGNISETELQRFTMSNNYNQIEKLLNDLINGEDVINQLNDIYKNNLEVTKTKYEQKIWDLKYNSLPKAQKLQIDNLIDIDEHGKAKKIMDNYKKYSDKVQRVETGYNIFCKLTSLFDVFQFTSDSLKININLIPKLAFALTSPDFLMPAYVDELLEKKEELPSSWYLHRKLTVAEYKEIINEENISQTWDKLYKLVKSSILNKADTPILPIIKRKDLLNSIILNFENQQYDSALIISFSVIEGLLWELSYEVDKKEKVFVNKSTMYDCDKKEFSSNRIRDVIERTVVRNYLDQDFIKEFCEELYEERNPVLHGNCICHYKCKNLSVCFIKKLFVLDYLLFTIEEVFQNNLFDIWDELISDEQLNEYLDFYKKTANPDL